jgi:hypothetical protein
VAESPFAPGQILAGKYRLERVIGSGGMGFVVAAWHRSSRDVDKKRRRHEGTASVALPKVISQHYSFAFPELRKSISTFLVVFSVLRYPQSRLDSLGAQNLNPCDCVRTSC